MRTACDYSVRLSDAIARANWGADMMAADEFRRVLAFENFDSVVGGRSLLSLCCEKNATRPEMLSVLQGLLQTEGNVHVNATTQGFDATNRPGYSPLMHLATSGDKACIRGTMCKILIDARADIHFRGANGMVPLLKAAASGGFDVSQVLLNAVADPRVTDSEGHNGFDFSWNTIRIRNLFRAKRVFESVKVSGTRRRGVS